MNQSRIDSIMEVVTGTIIGLIVSVFANYFWFTTAHGIAMTVAFNVATSVFFTVISIARSYIIRRVFNGRSVWVAIKDKYNGRNRTRLLQGQVAPNPVIRSRSSPLCRVVAEQPTGHRKRSYHFYGIREQGVGRACKQ